MKEYPLFIAPNEVPLTTAHEWSAKEAKLYFEWLMSVKETRVEYLLTVLDIDLKDNIKEDLKEIGKKVYDLLFTKPFSTFEGNEYTITNQGLALAADTGLLLAKFLISTYPILKWTIIKKPKRDLSYNLPALVGFPKKNYFEPIRVSTQDCRAILTNKESFDVWLIIYNYLEKQFEISQESKTDK